ncbi:hypothetical protein CCOS865_03092 [Pseudomonas reidholzensis]|uniref:Uncharacterized protein n=1 Tax=Pseudomonas reidholzensis TaxID=1785162 RepID=A0A383RV89_9PSED|nr:hypothetical protein CCOS865_03092 [Pseudomonas reidholzensis]
MDANTPIFFGLGTSIVSFVLISLCARSPEASTPAAMSQQVR